MPDGANPAQVLGYLQPITQQEMAKEHLPQTGYAGDDLVGQSGLEAQYNTALTGKPGTRTVAVNAAGDVLEHGRRAAAPQTGDTLVTSLNAKVQQVAEQALASAIAKSRAAGNDANQGAAVVETTDGRIVAMASYPDYNPSIWTNGISQQQFKYLFGTASGRAGAELGHPGAVRPWLDIQGHLDRRGGRRRVPARRHLPVSRRRSTSAAARSSTTAQPGLGAMSFAPR